MATDEEETEIGVTCCENAVEAVQGEEVAGEEGEETQWGILSRLTVVEGLKG